MTEPAMEPDRDASRGRWPWWTIALLTVALLVTLGAALWLRQSTSTPPLASPSVGLALQPGATPGITAASRYAPVSTPGLARRTVLPATGVFIEPGDGRDPLLDEIEAARHSIDLEVYLVSDEIILEALDDARRRGVDIRVIIEEHPFGGGGGQEDLFARLERARIAVRWGNPVFRFTHMKRTGNPETSR